MTAAAEQAEHNPASTSSSVQYGSMAALNPTVHPDSGGWPVVVTSWSVMTTKQEGSTAPSGAAMQCSKVTSLPTEHVTARTYTTPSLIVSV